MGNVRRARDLAAEFVRVHPESAVGFEALGVALSANGELAEARSAFERGVALDPSNVNILIARRALAMQQEHWSEVEAINAILARRPSPFARFASGNSAAFLALARGRGTAAFAEFERAAVVEGLPPSFRAIARSRQARLLLQQGKPALALAHAERAVAAAPNTDFEALQFVAIAQAALGRYADAEKTVAHMDARAQNCTDRTRTAQGSLGARRDRPDARRRAGRGIRTGKGRRHAARARRAGATAVTALGFIAQRCRRQHQGRP